MDVPRWSSTSKAIPKQKLTEWNRAPPASWPEPSWIDEADRQVARLEVEFYDNFGIAGGLLASVRKGTVIKVDQSPIGEGLWMQTANEQHMNMRVITKGIRQNVYVRSFDFKRFNVDANNRDQPLTR